MPLRAVWFGVPPLGGIAFVFRLKAVLQTSAGESFYADTKNDRFSDFLGVLHGS